MKRILCIAVCLFIYISTINSQSFYINGQNIVLSENIVSEKIFSEGLAVIQDNETKLYGYIDINRKIVIPCSYLYAKDFSEGVAAVQDLKTHKYGYINKKNEIVIPFIYDEATKFGYDRNDAKAFPGLAYVNIGISTNGQQRLITDGLWGLINIKGKEVLPIKCGYISPVSEGIASFVDGGLSADVAQTKGKMGFVNISGDIIIAPQYDFSYDSYFFNGLVTVYSKGEKYVIDRNGASLKYESP